jgi:hypothetical protein
MEGHMDEEQEIIRSRLFRGASQSSMRRSVWSWFGGFFNRKNIFKFAKNLLLDLYFYFVVFSFVFDFMIVGRLFTNFILILISLILNLVWNKRNILFVNFIFAGFLILLPFVNKVVVLKNKNTISTEVSRYYRKNNCVPENLTYLDNVYFYNLFTDIGGSRFNVSMSQGAKGIVLTWRDGVFHQYHHVINLSEETIYYCD